MKTNITQSNVESKVVLAKSLLNTADQLGLKEAQLASVIGVHCDTISILKPILNSTLRLSKDNWPYCSLIFIVQYMYSVVEIQNGFTTSWIPIMKRPKEFQLSRFKLLVAWPQCYILLTRFERKCDFYKEIMCIRI